jgi:predicted GTPase
MSRDSPAIRVLRWSLVGLGLALPALSLIPLGSVWLWERGLLIPWALAACVSTGVFWALQRWLLSPLQTSPAQAAPAPAPASDNPVSEGADPGWTPAENAAWARVQEIAAGADPDHLKTRDEVLDLGRRTVEAVARALHPERKDPLLQFTAPEALALVSRVSGRMNTFVRESVPLGDRLTLAQMRTLYEWRGALDVAEQAWSVWRVLRLVNPASALANEVRERLSKELMTWGKSHIARRLATVFVEEVGRAAIDLYGGRLRIAPERLGGHVVADSARDIAQADAPLAEPLRLLVAGQISAGKSSLVNALGQEAKAAVDALPATARFTPYRLEREGLPAALIVDSPGLAANEKPGQRFIEEVQRCDLLLWVAAANRADREIDRVALEMIRAHFAAHPERRMPPMLLVLTHVDRLRPFGEWQPPYDLEDAASPKATSMRAAVEAAAADLGFAASDVIPVCLSSDLERYNVDAVWGAISARLPEAQRARLVRTLRDAEGRWDVGRIWGQALAGGRVLLRSIR